MKIGWILSGGKGVAGARIQGWNMHEYFISKEIDSEVLIGPAEMNTDFYLTKKEIKEIIKQKFDVILVQKIQTGKNFLYFIDECHKNNIKVIYVGIDRIRNRLQNNSIVFDKTTLKLHEEMDTYTYGDDNKPIKVRDDAVDALRYASNYFAQMGADDYIASSQITNFWIG